MKLAKKPQTVAAKKKGEGTHGGEKADKKNTFGIIAFAVCFFMFTYFPPALGIFTQYSNSYP